MKKTYYVSVVKLNNNVYLYYNAFTDSYLLLNKKMHSIYRYMSLEKIEKHHPDFYSKLIDGWFIENDKINEAIIADYRKMQSKMSTHLYNVVVNTTLDCNLDCWYCYESKVKDSILTEEAVEIVKKNIAQKYNEIHYKELKISFFGGEPLVNFKAIEELLGYCKEFSEERGISLIADFTTNATLISENQLSFLKDYRCFFQITLDGDEKKHNKVRFFKEDKKESYRIILNNIYRIQNKIDKSRIWIRINFDNNTLNSFSEILNDLSGLDRKRNYIILRKIWQFPIDKIEDGLILKTLQMALDSGFYIDNYSLPRYEPCFADRLHQVLFNYDGKVFKCSTIEKFDNEHAEGTVCKETGVVEWEINNIAIKMASQSPPKCKKCKIYPACMGPCGKNSNKGNNFICMIDNTGLSMDEYIMYNYKLKLIERTLIDGTL